jgi:hypothetical protein
MEGVEAAVGGGGGDDDDDVDDVDDGGDDGGDDDDDGGDDDEPSAREAMAVAQPRQRVMHGISSRARPPLRTQQPQQSRHQPTNNVALLSVEADQAQTQLTTLTQVAILALPVVCVRCLSFLDSICEHRSLCPPCAHSC